MALFSPHTPPATGRSKTVRGPDDGIGPSVDEFFTLSLGGMVTVSATAYRPAPPRASQCAPRAHRHALSDAQLLNTSSASIFAGDLCEWTLSYANAAKSNAKRARHGPRRVGIQTATVSSPKVIGRALSFAKPVCCRPQNCPPPLPPSHKRPQLTTLPCPNRASRLTSCSNNKIIDVNDYSHTSHATGAPRASSASSSSRPSLRRGSVSYL